MATILNLLVERLNVKISRLKRAREKLRDKNLEDKKLDYQINRLVSICDRLTKKNSTGGDGSIRGTEVP